MIILLLGVHDSEQFTVEQKEKKKAYLGMLIPPPLRALIGELHESGVKFVRIALKHVVNFHTPSDFGAWTVINQT